MLTKCYATEEKVFQKIFSIPTAMVCATSDGVPPLSTVITLATLAHPATLAPTARSIVSPPTAVVIVGKAASW